MKLSDSSAAWVGNSVVMAVNSITTLFHHFYVYTDFLLSAAISGAVGAIKDGLGILTFSATNTYSGNTAINSGVLSITSTAALPGWNVNGRYSVEAGATLAVYNVVVDADVVTMLATTNFKANSAIGFDTTSGARTYPNAITNTAQGVLGLTKLGANTLTLSGACTYTGPTQINQGTLTVTSASTLDGVISGSGSLEKRGVNILTLGGNNTYSGGTFFYSGGISAYIVYNSSNAFGTGLFTVSNAAGRIDTGGNVTLPNDFLINSSSLQYRTTGANTITVTGNISGIGGINKTGNGFLDLQGTLTYTGGTTITAGTIRAYKTVGASTATATFTTGLSVSFNVSPPSGTTTFRFFQGSTTNSYPSVTLVGVPVGTTATYTSATSTLAVTVP